MKKIIKQGITNARTTCDYCGCVFEFTIDEVEYRRVTCPNCESVLLCNFNRDYEKRLNEIWARIEKINNVGKELKH